MVFNQQDLPGYAETLGRTFPLGAYAPYTPEEMSFCGLVVGGKTCQFDNECCENAACMNRLTSDSVSQSLSQQTLSVIASDQAVSTALMMKVPIQTAVCSCWSDLAIHNPRLRSRWRGSQASHGNAGGRHGGYYSE